MIVPRLPVIMYHSVGRPDPSWVWGKLACPLSLFSRQIERLKADGYRSATLDEVHDEQAAGSLSRERRVVLSFDDGYLDNWVHVYPLLKRAGWRGIVYVNPEFVDPGERPRPTLDDVWAGRCAESDLQTKGFLNWAELEILDRSGVLEVGSHSMSHTWYPTGPEIVDFHRPGLATPWLAWNVCPERKPFYLGEDQTGFVSWGTPIHSHGRSLGIRRYIPDPDVAAAAVAHVAACGGPDFFVSADWRQRLQHVVQEADNGRGRPESDLEMLARFTYEVGEASRILAMRLGRPMRHYCWPGGAYSDESWRIAENTGFRTLTVKRTDSRRWHSADPRLVRRISDHHRYSLFGKTHETSDPGLLVAACGIQLGRSGAQTNLRVRKVFNVVGLSRPNAEKVTPWK